MSIPAKVSRLPGRTRAIFWSLVVGQFVVFVVLVMLGMHRFANYWALVMNPGIVIFVLVHRRMNDQSP
jgi:low affinity Fe/Cu permease